MKDLRKKWGNGWKREIRKKYKQKKIRRKWGGNEKGYSKMKKNQGRNGVNVKKRELKRNNEEVNRIYWGINEKKNKKK